MEEYWDDLEDLCKKILVNYSNWRGSDQVIIMDFGKGTLVQIATRKFR
jgi:hypothetical protein